jgi:uncharacterized membrane protein YjjP (DUF1212 family)
MQSRSLALLFALVSAAIPSVAVASYQDGAWGVMLVLVSAPIAAGATILSLLLAAFGQFKKPVFFKAYVAVFVISALAVVVMSSSADDPLSLGICFAGELVLLIPVLAPAIIQYKRWQRRHTD